MQNDTPSVNTTYAFYTTMRVEHGVIVLLEDHLRRIKDSAERLAMPLPCTINRIAQMLQDEAGKHQSRLARIRVTINRAAKKASILIVIEPLTIDPRIYSEGIHAITMQMERPMPAIKSTDGLITKALAAPRLKAEQAYEAIGIGKNGNVLEGSITNVFVVRGSVLFTPRTCMLPGLTRRVAIDIARKQGIDVRIQNFTEKVLLAAEEVFLTNQLREIIPVVQINGQKIGCGRPGALTKRLMEAYRGFVEEYVRNFQ